MTSILKAQPEDISLLARLGSTTFIESHGNSAAKKDIDQFVNENFTEQAFKEELQDPNNIYYIIYHDNQPAGYSKIIYNFPYLHIQTENVTKLARIYLLKDFYGLQLGRDLLQFNIKLSKQNNQMGMWLFAWIENHRALNFYKKSGFEIIGNYDYKISENHTNPNYQMLVRW